MMTLNIKPDEAWHLLSTVEHGTFTKSLNEHWTVDGDGNVKAQSALWLYCWAKTGMNSDDVANRIQKIFDQIMSVKFEDFDRRISHQWAREKRYHDGDIEAELALKLSR